MIKDPQSLTTSAGRRSLIQLAKNDSFSQSQKHKFKLKSPKNYIKLWAPHPDKICTHHIAWLLVSLNLYTEVRSAKLTQPTIITTSNMLIYLFSILYLESH